MTYEARRATMADLDGMASALGRAFADDPLMSYVIPDAGRRHRVLAPMFALELGKMGLRVREVYTTPEQAGAAIWAAPDTWKTSPLSMLPMLPGMVRLMGVGGMRRLMNVFGTLEKRHPKESHWYLEGLGTDPDHQRRGVGAALMRPVLERCDADGVPAYLETQRAENVPYYRHHGFEVKGEVDVPKGGPHLWLMWREPRSA
jgi:ribosomal protein S18 acetylase RimI-like enzyme